MRYLHLMTNELSVAVDDRGVWRLRGTAADKFGLVNEFLGYLADRHFSSQTCRAYAYDLLAANERIIASTCDAAIKAHA